MGFWIRLLLYIAPFALGFLGVTGFLIYAGESMPLGMVLEQQAGDTPTLFRYRYGNRDQQYKIMATNRRGPEVLAIGSSRILQFRDRFFNRAPERFYNAAAPAWTLDQIERVLQDIDEAALPRVLILALDPPWFNDAYAPDVFPPDVSDYANLFLVNRSFAQDVLAGESFDISQYLAREDPGGDGAALGLRAIRDGHGFRRDGSEQYGDFLVAQWLSPAGQRAAHMAKMQAGEDMYVRGDTPSPEKLAQLAALLDWAAAHEITVIGYLPSYAPSLWEAMMRGGQHAYVAALPPVLRAMFAERSFAFFDFSDVSGLGLTDADFFDGWHLSELGNLMLYTQMVYALPDLLGPYSDTGLLEADIRSATDTFRVYGG
jgi:hypothetical protein